jgi:hypothetical protein
MRRVSARRMWVIAAVVSLGWMGAGGAVAATITGAPAGHNPSGNNGTVKIDNQPFDDAPNNEPHVGCRFQVDFYGYDEGDLNAKVTFVAQSPTLPAGADRTLLTDEVAIGEDDASGGGSEGGLDASRTYELDLTGITPHEKQGVHVKLTINAEGSRGADVKHKVFWVTPCETPTPTPTPTPSSSATATSSTSPSTTPTPVPGGGTTCEESDSAEVCDTVGVQPAFTG